MTSHTARLILTLLLALLAAPSQSEQQPKRVFITLDVSGSMSGNKYALANYTTQLLVTLCDKQDQVNMIVYGVNKCLSDQNQPLALIQKPMHTIKLGKPTTNASSQFDDIIAFNHIYQPSQDKQDWLFIIGDGIWGTLTERGKQLNPYYKKELIAFKEIVQNGSLNVCYLQTGEKLKEDNDFTQFSTQLGVIDIAKSDVNPQTIKDRCDHFARKILGFSDIPLKVKKSGGKCISITAELPILSFYLVYQDKTKPASLPQITTINANQQTLNSKLKGTPTTIPTKSRPTDIDLSANVWHVTPNTQRLTPNTNIEICFDKDIDPHNISIYPLVQEVEFGSFVYDVVGGKLKQLDTKTFCINSDQNTALVRIQLSEQSKENLPESLLKKTNVIVKANNKDYKAKYNNGGFECKVDLNGQETQYYAECDLPGYFKRVTPIMTIEKGDCPSEPVSPPEPPAMKLPVMDFGSISYEFIKHNPLGFYLHDIKSKETLDPNKFDIEVEVDDSYLYQEPTIRFNGDTILLDIRPKSDLCECLFPKEVNFTIISTPKQGAFQNKGINYSRTEQPGRVTIVKDRPWFLRCLWVLITLAALILFILYLRALLKKNRFHKNARLKNSYVVEDSPKEQQKNGKPLRKPGFGPWLNRWLNPIGHEKTTINFTRPKTPVMTFTASPSKNKVLLSASSFDPDKMTIPLYNPRLRDQKKNAEPIPITAGTSIEIKKTQGGETTRLGHLMYVVEGKDDEGGYRFFIVLLMVLSILAFITLALILIRSVI